MAVQGMAEPGMAGHDMAMARQCMAGHSAAWARLGKAKVQQM